jgi:hypothetical protein
MGSFSLRAWGRLLYRRKVIVCRSSSVPFVARIAALWLAGFAWLIILLGAGPAVAQGLPNGTIEIRFFNSTSRPDSEVIILPSAGANSSLTNLDGTYVYWDKNSNSTLNGASANTTLALTSLAFTPASGGKGAYYSAYTTNFNNAAWLIGLNTPSLTFNASAPSPNNPTSNWGGYTYQPFELTIDGNVADVGDITYINQFGLPMQMRSFTDGSPTASPTFVTGFQGNGTQVQSAFQTMAARMQASFPDAFVPSVGGANNPSGLALISAPNSSTPGSLISIAGGNQSFAPMTDYFNKVKASQTNNGSVTRIKDFINLTQNSETYSYYYDFTLDTLDVNNTLKLTGNVTVVPGTGGNASAAGNYTGLAITIGSDGGNATSLWASSFVYLAPTPGNRVGSPTPWPDFALTGNWSTIAISTGYNGTMDSLAFGGDDFSLDVIGRIMGDLAAGFAFGFVDSDVLNPNYLGGNVTYGSSPSGSWWGGNEFPAGGNNTFMYGDVQPDLSSGNNTFYSEYGGILFDATPLAYGHPIADRMQYYADIQIPVYGYLVNGTETVYIQAVEVEFWDGIDAIPEPSVTVLVVMGGAAAMVRRRRRVAEKGDPPRLP